MIIQLPPTKLKSLNEFLVHLLLLVDLLHRL
jgi:hypothetical protein